MFWSRLANDPHSQRFRVAATRFPIAPLHAGRSRKATQLARLPVGRSGDTARDCAQPPHTTTIPRAIADCKCRIEKIRSAAENKDYETRECGYLNLEESVTSVRADAGRPAHCVSRNCGRQPAAAARMQTRPGSRRRGSSNRPATRTARAAVREHLWAGTTHRPLAPDVR